MTKSSLLAADGLLLPAAAAWKSERCVWSRAAPKLYHRRVRGQASVAEYILCMLRGTARAAPPRRRAAAQVGSYEDAADDAPSAAAFAAFACLFCSSIAF
eukprot:SAG11_NODE_3517_length_2396_cov_4.692207_2_plen_100_part_00